MMDSAELSASSELTVSDMSINDDVPSSDDFTSDRCVCVYVCVCVCVLRERERERETARRDCGKIPV